METIPSRIINAAAVANSSATNCSNAIHLTLLYTVAAGFLFHAVAHATEATNTISEATAATNRVSVAMFRFENATGERTLEHWGYAADTVFRNSLHEVKGLRSLPDPTLNYGLRTVKLKPVDSLSVTQLQAVGKAIVAQWVVTGSYRREAGQWQLTLHVFNVAAGQTTTNLSAASTNWFALRDQLAEPLVNALGVTATSAERARMMRRWTKSSTALEWVNRARECFKLKLPETAWEQCANHAIEADPDCVEAYIVLAATEGSEGRFGAARTALNKAITLNPDMARGYVGLGRIALVSGHPEDAAAPLSTAARLDPDNADAFNRLGELAVLQKNRPQAAGDFARAVELSPFEASLHANLAHVYALQGKRDDALQELQCAEGVIADGDINSERTIAQTYAQLNLLPAAIKHYQALVAAAHKTGVSSKKIQEDEKELRRLKALNH